MISFDSTMWDQNFYEHLLNFLEMLQTTENFSSTTNTSEKPCNFWSVMYSIWRESASFLNDGFS